MLSKEQQGIIEDSLWVVNTALKRQGLQEDDDLRQSAFLYMCECLERFDPSKNIKWTTFAYKNIYLFIKRTHAKQKLKNSYLVDDDIYYLNNEAIKFGEFKEEDICELYEEKKQIDTIKALCSPDECEFINLRLMGYKGAEISEIMGCSGGKVVSIMKTIKEKVREIDYDRIF